MLKFLFKFYEFVTCFLLTFIKVYQILWIHHFIKNGHFFDSIFNLKVFFLNFSKIYQLKYYPTKVYNLMFKRVYQARILPKIMDEKDQINQRINRQS